jgi:hypothetical protein
LPTRKTGIAPSPTEDAVRAHLFRGVQHAAVGKLEAGAGPELRQPLGRAGRDRDLIDLQLAKGCSGHAQLPRPRRTHQYLGDRHRAGAQLVVRDLQQRRGRPGAAGLVAVEMGDQDARVEDDHAAHSSRSAER